MNDRYLSLGFSLQRTESKKTKKAVVVGNKYNVSLFCAMLHTLPAETPILLQTIYGSIKHGNLQTATLYKLVKNERISRISDKANQP